MAYVPCAYNKNIIMTRDTLFAALRALAAFGPICGSNCNTADIEKHIPIIEAELNLMFPCLVVIPKERETDEK